MHDITEARAAINFRDTIVVGHWGLGAGSLEVEPFSPLPPPPPSQQPDTKVR